MDHLFSQGFLSDLLEKANRRYDDKKLEEYTQTIVSEWTPLSSWRRGKLYSEQL